MTEFSGQRVLVTGGSRGIGLAAARLFRAQGANVAIVGRDAARLRDAARAIDEDVLALRGDLADCADVDAVYSQLEAAFGGLDVLFANAGAADWGALDDLDPAAARQLFDVSVHGLLLCVQRALRLMRSGGRIVISTGSLDRKATAEAGYFSTSRAALRALTQSLAVRCAERGIRVNAVSPGGVETELWQRTVRREGAPCQGWDGWARRSPLQRLGRPEEVAEAVLFLASERASFVLGAELAVDGGLGLV